MRTLQYDPVMLTAAWVLAGGTCLLALTSIIAVVTWRDSRRRVAQDQERARADEQQQRILDAARKEFAAKDDVGGLKSNLIGIGVVGAVITALVVWGKLSGGEGSS
jgi:hypothetical protein